MKRAFTRINAVNSPRKAEKFNRVFDEKKRRVRGLWERKRCYYAQLDANNGKQYKYPLHAATTVPQALTEMQVLRKTQREGKLLPPSLMGGDKREHQNECTNGRVLREAINEYKTHREALKADDEKTWRRENSSLARWEEKYGDLPLGLIDDATTKEYAKWRQSKNGGEVCGRTVDLDIGTIHKVVDRAVELHWLPKSPSSRWKKLNKGPARVVRLERVKKVTGIRNVGFHHFRHYFISHCVMAQPWIDHMTIAIWVSHRDKGILIGKRYGHLRPGHSAQMAKHLDSAFEF